MAAPQIIRPQSLGGTYAGEAVPRDQSPVEMELIRFSNLLDRLREATNSLADRIKGVMEGDPRDRPLAECCTKQPESCPLEGELRDQNDRLDGLVRLLREVHEAVRL